MSSIKISKIIGILAVLIFISSISFAQNSGLVKYELELKANGVGPAKIPNFYDLDWPGTYYANQHDIDSGTVGYSKWDADQKLLDGLRKDGFSETIMDLWAKALRSETCQGAYLDAQKKARNTQRYKKNAEAWFGYEIDTDKYHILIKD